MVRRLNKQYNQNLPQSVTSIINSEARMLAKKYHRNVKQVNEILIRIVEDYQSTGQKDSVRIPRMDTVFSNISANRVLALLERVGKKQFRELLAYIHYMENVFTPLYSLDELTDVISSFRYHLYACSMSLEGTGYPDKLFTKSKWLDSLLNKLYITKLPANIRLKNGLLNYKWVSRSINGRDKKHCTYDEVECIGIFKREDAERLDKDRHIVHSVKLKILKILHDSLKTKSLKSLWKDCLEALTKTIDYEQADFFIRMDRLYEKHGLVALGHVAFPSIASSGGLWDILTVIGHVEQELKGEIYCSIRKRLDKQIHKSLNFGSRLNIEKFLKHIVFKEEGQRENFFEFVRSKLQKEEQLREEYLERIKNALSERFGNIIVLPKEIAQTKMTDLHFQRPWERTVHTAHTRKPIIEIDRRTRSIKIDGALVPPEESKGHVGDLVDATSFALDECKRGKPIGRPYFNRKDLCGHLGIANDTRMAHIFGGTPFWRGGKDERLIKRPGGIYLYYLDVDLDKSTSL